MYKLDFEQDLKQEIHSMFRDYGIKIPIKKLDEMILDYLTIHKKIIVPKPRQVLYNPALMNLLLSYPKKKEIQYIHFLFDKGKNVNFFQSRKLFQTRFHDHLLYEWNIYHFHLSLEKEKKEIFVKPNNQLLFVYVDEGKAIFLGVEKHTPGIFADVRWLEILHDHFPEVLEPLIAKDTIDVYPKLNSLERQTLWDKGYTMAMTKVREKVYFSSGLGRTTSGHSMKVVKTTGAILRWMHDVEQQFYSKFEQICIYLKIPLNDAKFKLRFGNKTLEIVQESSRQVLLTFPEILDESTLG